jgi:DNA-binding NarL/FixJ family response regulator
LPGLISSDIIARPKKAAVAKSPIRILVVEDFEPFRAFVTSALAQQPELHIVGELSDGLEAVGRAAELHPDLILLDIGLPSLNGIAAARRIREHSPQTKILFVSGDQSSDIVEQALSTGAAGYLVKSDAGRHLLVAVGAVLQGKHYLSSSLSDLHVNHNGHQHASTYASSKPKQVTPPPPQREIAGHHEVVFYSDDRQLLNRVSQFIGPVLNAGNTAIVLATDSHRQRLVRSLEANGVDLAAALEQSRYIALDAADTLSSCMVNGVLDSGRFLQCFENLILKATTAARGEHPRVAFFGECVDILWKQGNAETAVQVEEGGTQLSGRYNVDILCGYSVEVQGVMQQEAIQRICAEHSAVYRP